MDIFTEEEMRQIRRTASRGAIATVTAILGLGLAIYYSIVKPLRNGRKEKGYNEENRENNQETDAPFSCSSESDFQTNDCSEDSEEEEIGGDN